MWEVSIGSFRWAKITSKPLCTGKNKVRFYIWLLVVRIVVVHTFGSFFATRCRSCVTSFSDRILSPPSLQQKGTAAKDYATQNYWKDKKEITTTWKKNPIIHKKICRHSWSPWADTLISSACSFATSTGC